MRILAVTAVALLTVSAAAQAQQYDRYDQDSELPHYIPYGSLISARVEDARGHTVGRLVGMDSRISGQVSRAEVELTTPDEAGKVVSIDARDMIVRPSPSDERPAYSVQSTLTYPEIEAMPPRYDAY